MILLAANAYFIKRLIDKLDHTDQKATDALSEAKTYSRAAEKFLEQIREIRTDIRDMRSFDKQIAVVESQLALLLAKEGFFSNHGGGTGAD